MCRTAASVELAVAGESAFRVSLASGGALPKAIESPMIATQTKFAAFTQVKDGSRVGIGRLARMFAAEYPAMA